MLFERGLSRVVSNDRAFRLADVGRNRDIDQYDVPISAFERYWISPAEIERHTGREYPFWTNRRNMLGKV